MSAGNTSFQTDRGKASYVHEHHASRSSETREGSGHTNETQEAAVWQNSESKHHNIEKPMQKKPLNFPVEKVKVLSWNFLLHATDYLFLQCDVIRGQHEVKLSAKQQKFQAWLHGRTEEHVPWDGTTSSLLATGSWIRHKPN